MSDTYNDNFGFTEVGHPAGLVESPGVGLPVPATPVADSITPATGEAVGLSNPSLLDTPSVAPPENTFSDPNFAGAPATKVLTEPGPSVLGAAFRQENIIGAIAAAARDQAFPADPKHNPWNTIKGTDLENEWKAFAGSQSQPETDQIAARIRAERRDRQTLEAAGWNGTWASLLAGIVDPTMLIPIGGEVAKGAQVARAGVAAAKAAGRTGAEVGAVVAAHEAAMQSLQYERPLSESVAAVGGSVVLGALLGAGVSGLASRQFSELSGRLQDVLRVPEDSAKDPFGIGGVETVLKEAQSAGAAVSAPKSEARLKPILGLERINEIRNPALRAATAPLRWVMRQDPVIRGLTSPFPSARESTVMMADTSLSLTRNALGEATAPIAGSVEGGIAQHGPARFGEAKNASDDIYRAYVKRVKGEGGKPLDYGSFHQEVGRSMSRFDKHDIPEVAQAAKVWRDTVFDPTAKKAVRLGALDRAVLGGEPSDTGAIAAGRTPLKPKKYAALEPLRGMLRQIEKMTGKKLAPDIFDQHIEALDRVHPPVLEALQRTVAKVAGGVTEADIESVKGLHRFVQDTKGSKPSERLNQWIVNRGGINDTTGDVKNIIGKHTARPGLMNKSGLPLDEMALRAWEQGFIQTPERATVNDLLAAIEEDFRGNAVVRSADSEMMLNHQAAQDARAQLEGMGVVKPTDEEDAVRQYIEAKAAKGGAAPTPEARAILDKALTDTLGHPSAAPLKTELTPNVAARVWDDNGQSYLTRVYNKAKIQAQSGQFKKILVDWFASRQAAARAVIDGVEKISADDELKLAEFIGFTHDDLDGIAHEVMKNILGHPDGLVMFDLPMSVRGPLKSRTLRIPDALIEDFLERNVQHVGRYYLNTVVPQLEMIRVFGDLEMTGQLARINDEARALQNAAKSEKEKARLIAMHEEAVSDLQAMRDRQLGTFNSSSIDPSSKLVRTGRALRMWNIPSHLGNMTLSALSDPFRIMMVHGVKSYFGDAILPMLDNLKGIKAVSQDLKLTGTALDMELGQRSTLVNDVLDDYGRFSAPERLLHWGVEKFGFLSLMNHWNAGWKSVAAVGTIKQIVGASLKVAEGTASAREIEMLASHSIEAPQAKIIAQQFQKYGQRIPGTIGSEIFVPNTLAWESMKNPNVRNALETFRAAIKRDVDKIIVTPGQDKPLWMSTEMGALAGQFQSFGMATVQRTILAGLQQRDAGVLVGAMSMLAMGAISVALRNVVNGKPQPADTAQWIENAVDASGLVAYLFQVNHFAESWTGGAIGLQALTGRPLSRYAARNWADAILGPTAGTVKDLSSATADISRHVFNGEDIHESSVRALRRVLPLQNLFYMSWLFRQMEAGADSALGAKAGNK